MTLEKLCALTHGLDRRIPNGNDPFQMMTCLFEEIGDLAQMIDHVVDCGLLKARIRT